MSRIPHHKNMFQASLYNQGKKDIGKDMANVLPDHKVREAGVDRLMRRGGKLVGGAVVAAGVTIAAAKGYLNDRDAAVTQHHNDTANMNANVANHPEMFTPDGTLQPDAFEQAKARAEATEEFVKIHTRD